MEIAAAIEQIINAQVERWRAMRAAGGTYYLTQVGFVGGGFIGQTSSNDLARDPAVRSALDELSGSEDTVIVWHR